MPGKSTAKIRNLLSGTTALKRHVATAAKRETAARDTLLLQDGDIGYKLDNLMMRRRVSALAQQHRVTQRLDKEIALLRCALGLPQLPPEEVVRTHLTMRDPTANEDLMVASSKWNAEWARGVTARGIQSLRDKFLARGYAYQQKKDGHTVVHEWAGLCQGVADLLELTTLGSSWCAVAVRNGKNLPLFELNPTAASVVERGIPVEMASATWDGALKTSDAQQYAHDFATLVAGA